MYKLTRPDGFDFFSGTINYRENIGKTIRVKDFDPDKTKTCARGLHASRKPNDCFFGAGIPCAAFRVKGRGLIARDPQKSRYQALEIMEEIFDLSQLFGWSYSEVINPVNPFSVPAPVITTAHIHLLYQWASVRASMGTSVGAYVGASVWDSVRDYVWDSVWDYVWDYVGDSMWDSMWDSVRDSVMWDSVRASMGTSVRTSVRTSVWDSVGAYFGSLFPKIKWEYPEGLTTYPFQACAELWREGLVPSFDKKLWRLHGGPQAEILWAGAN